MDGQFEQCGNAGMRERERERACLSVFKNVFARTGVKREKEEEKESEKRERERVKEKERR